MTLRVSLKGKKSIQGVSDIPYSLWRYQITLDKTLTNGEVVQAPSSGWQRAWSNSP
jgi:hypothetical protein